MILNSSGKITISNFKVCLADATNAVHSLISCYSSHVEGYQGDLQ